MKSNLKSFLPIFLILGTFSYVFSSNSNEENSHLISKEPSYSNDLSKSVFSFSQNEYFISSNAIIEQGRDIVYGQIDGSVFYSGNNPSNFTFSFSNDSICSLVESTYNEEEHTIFFTLKGLKKGYTALQIEDSAKIVGTTDIYVLDSYYNFSGEKIIAINTIDVKNPYRFEIKLIDGADISGIKQEEISFELIENENNCLTVLKAPAIIVPEYGISLQTTQNTGNAKVLCSYTIKDSNQIKHTVFQTIYDISVVDSTRFINFYTLDENDELVAFSDENPAEVRSFTKKSIYIGNKTNEFDTSIIQILNNEDLGNFVYCEIKKDDSFEYPMLRLDIVPKGEATMAEIQIGVKNTSVFKTLKVSIVSSNYFLKINTSFLNQYYYLFNKPHFSNLMLENPEFFIVKDLSNELVFDNSSLDIRVSPLSNRLGLQRVYIYVKDFDLHYGFDIKFTLNPKYNGGVDEASDASKIMYFYDFLDYATNNLENFYSLDEVYNDLEYEYINTLNVKCRNVLASDYHFLRLYRRFIIKNDFDKSFFGEIKINLGSTRLVYPTLVIVAVIVSIIAIFIVSFYFIYRKKGNIPDDQEN